ncbi:MAG: aminoglycoside phosphotransferase family protein, partial [Anaerolineae bacterium]|nr:aminoglycoside phosphotransferase family protein [Anaerolineae bacterium]
ALHGLHHVSLPPALAERLPREIYAPQWREQVRDFLRRGEVNHFPDPVAAELSALLQDERPTILRLVQRAETLAAVLQAQSPPFVLCHADIHAGNVLIDAHDQLYVVDWDTLILAPKERDLMYVGGGLFTRQRTPAEEERLFYQGYGPTEVEVDPVGIAYYRCERIVQDIAAYCAQILLTEGDGPDRAEGLRQLRGQFQPGEVIEIAFRSERALPPAYRGE